MRRAFATTGIPSTFRATPHGTTGNSQRRKSSSDKLFDVNVRKASNNQAIAKDGVAAAAATTVGREQEQHGATLGDAATGWNQTDDAKEIGNEEAKDVGGDTMVLKDGRVMAPAFQVGNLLCHDVTTTSVRVAWPKPTDKKYPVHSYRVCTAEVGSGFEVTYGEVPSFASDCVVVGLHPGKLYQFLVASVSAERLLVPGSSIVSDAVRLPEAEYEVAWFFEEGGGDGRKWTAFEGLGPECVESTGAVEDSDVAAAFSAMDYIRCFPSPVRCYSGIQSLCIVVPPGLTGGAFVDAPAREGWLYVARARIFHEEAPPSSSAEQPEAGTRLVLWDMRDGKETSVPATKMGEWEPLECQIVPSRSEHLRIAVHTGGAYQGNIYVDKVELFHGGPTPAERAVSSIYDAMNDPRSTRLKVQVRVESACNVKAADAGGPSDPFVKVFVGDAEACRTKVIPMTLSPSWDETFNLSLDAGGGVDGGGGLRFELWDHNVHGDGDYLGEARLTNRELATAPPHRMDHEVVKDGAGGGGGGASGDPQGYAARFRRSTAGFDAVTAAEPPTLLALAMQVWWPEDPAKPEGKLVQTLQDEESPLSARLKALKELSLAANREPSNIEGAARAKEALVRARAPEAAVWMLSDPAFLEDACRLLGGLVTLGRGAAGAAAGPGLHRRLQQHVMRLSPAVVVVRCLRANIGHEQILLDLLAKLYIGQQAALHEDVLNIRAFFYCLVVHVEAAAPAQALMREISGGSREFPSELLSQFRRYRTRIPPLPGLWRPSVLKQLAGETAAPPDAERDDLEADELAPRIPFRNRRGPPTLEVIRSNVIVILLSVPPFFMLVVGGKRVGSDSSCEQPVATVILLDGLLLFLVVLFGGGFKVNQHRFSALAVTWFFPMLLAAFLAHVALVVGLLAAIAGVDYVGSRDEANPRASCSSATLAWGIFFLVVDIACFLAPPAFKCLWWYRKATQTVSVLVVPGEVHGGQRTDDKIPVGNAAVKAV